MKIFHTPIFILFLLTFSSCTTSNQLLNKREFRRSKDIATYSDMANELVDDYFILKSNNYFKFYKKLWMVVSIKMSAYPGRYTQKKDTLFLTWMDGDPKKISPYLSNKCIIDSISKELWFLDDLTGVKVKSMTLRANK